MSLATSETRSSWLVDPPRHVYVHVPFCVDRCTYCAFTTVHEDPRLHEGFVDAILAEWHRSPTTAPLETLYLGGGTPGQLPPRLLERLIHGLTRLSPLRAGAEVTLEVNPRNVDRHRLSAWSDLGITRLSVGIQTFRDDVLHRFARRHSGNDALAALEAVSTRWTQTWSADLLVGWAGQSTDDVSRDTSRLIGFSAPHMSIYGLTVEDNTPLSRSVQNGRKATLDRVLADRLDQIWCEQIEAAGLGRYEVSNFARPGHRSRHNEAYWRNETYIGLGPGASSSWSAWRWTNEPDLGIWQRRSVDGGPVRARCERLDPWARLLETLAVGLRTSEGIPWSRLLERFGSSLVDPIEGALSPLVESGHLIRDPSGVRIPREHLVKADHLVSLLVSQLPTNPAHSLQ